MFQLRYRYVQHDALKINFIKTLLLYNFITSSCEDDIV